jgi:hypothetical protein
LAQSIDLAGILPEGMKISVSETLFYIKKGPWVSEESIFVLIYHPHELLCFIYILTGCFIASIWLNTMIQKLSLLPSKRSAKITPLGQFYCSNLYGRGKEELHLMSPHKAGFIFLSSDYNRVGL